MMNHEKLIRIVPELRNYHVRNDNLNPGATTLYFKKKYDLSVATPDHFRQVSPWRAAIIAANPGYTRLMIWEPLWVRMLSWHIIITIVWHASTLRRRPVGSYAMENNDLASLMGGSRRVPGFLVEFFAIILGWYMRFAYDSMVYASEGSKSAYHRIPGVRHISNTTILNLPARRSEAPPSPYRLAVIMLARMERRKGTKEIMLAWPEVETLFPDARLHLVGSGPEQSVMTKWAAERPAARIFHGALEHDDALRLVAKSEVLVLPSIREGRWREQIGLPIQEALAFGLTVVTTDETGLSSYLSRAGHRVVPAQAVTNSLAGAIIDALRNPLDRSSVASSLPSVDGRIASERWLAGDSA